MPYFDFFFFFPPPLSIVIFVALGALSPAAPNAGKSTVALTAFVGSKLVVPVAEHVVAPLVRLGEAGRVAVPIVNPSDQTLEFVVRLDAPWTFEIVRQGATPPYVVWCVCVGCVVCVCELGV